MHDKLEAELGRILKEPIMKAHVYHAWFWEAIEQDICPHCETPIKRRIAKGYRYCVEPCGCELFKGTIERMKVVSLDEYRKAKVAHTKRKSEAPGYKLPFKIYCKFRSRYDNYLKAKLAQKLRARRLLQTKEDARYLNEG